jgi:hypothetical protein
VEKRGRLSPPPPCPCPLHHLVRTLTQKVFSPPLRASVAVRAMPLTHSFCFRVCYFLFSVRLASRLAISMAKVIPYGSLCTHLRPYNMSTACIEKGRNQHNQAETSPGGHTQGLATPSHKGIRLEPERQFTPSVMILRT